MSSKPKKEPLSVRVDPKTKFALSLMTRKERRNLSNLIEHIINESISNSTIKVNGKEMGMMDVVDKCWDCDSDNRIINMSEIVPQLLKFDESVRLKELKGDK